MYLSAAISRLLRQRHGQRMRSASHIASNILQTLLWHLSNSVPRLPQIVYDNYNSQRVRLTNCEVLMHGNSPYAVLYVHGGAWGSGAAWQYSALCSNLSTQCGCTVLCADYRKFPDADMYAQVDDIVECVEYAQSKHHLVGIVAHSSGAHVCALALCTGRVQGIRCAVLQAGVYDILAHYWHECQRGVAHVSPLWFAAGEDVNELPKRSPRTIVENNGWKGDMGACDRSTSILLEGDLGARWVKTSQLEEAHLYIMSATEDIVVPVHR